MCNFSVLYTVVFVSFLPIARILFSPINGIEISAYFTLLPRPIHYSLKFVCTMSSQQRASAPLTPFFFTNPKLQNSKWPMRTLSRTVGRAKE